jgi:hypothetical protein
MMDDDEFFELDDFNRDDMCRDCWMIHAGECL